MVPEGETKILAKIGGARVLLAEDKPDRLLREMTSVLAGDIWRDDNRWQAALLRARG